MIKISDTETDYGITGKNMKRSLKHAAIITFIGFFVVTALGYIIGFKTLYVDPYWVLFYILISVPVQELIFRGFLQTKLSRFGEAEAVIISSTLYAAIHFSSPLMIVLTFTAGLAWGVSFSRAKNIWGPVISHAILGLYLLLFVL